MSFRRIKWKAWVSLRGLERRRALGKNLKIIVERRRIKEGKMGSLHGANEATVFSGLSLTLV